MIHTAILNRLTSDATIIAAVAQRVYADVLPQHITYPAIRFFHVSTVPRDLHHSGPLNIAIARFQIDCFANSADTARTLANRVRELFHGFKGIVASQTILLSRVESEMGGFNLDSNAFFSVVEVMLTYREN